jgi:hypothetical protein
MPNPTSDRFSLQTLKLDILHPKLLKLFKLSFFHDLTSFGDGLIFFKKNPENI